MHDKWTLITGFMDKGGVAIWVIAGLAALTLGLVLWKALRLSAQRAWSTRRADRAVARWIAGDRNAARRALGRGRGLYRTPVSASLDALENPALSDAARREEISRVASAQLTQARGGLRALELIATVAPLVGLLGTVLGMVAAFQALEAAGNRADPSALAGGIWEALLTTAAGMAVAIPASVALTWYESIADRAQHRIEDMVTRLFVAHQQNADAPQPSLIEVAE